MTENITIRPATPADALAIATVHVFAWQSVYRDIVSHEYLDALSIEPRAKRWAQNMNNPLNQMFAYLAETEAKEIVGFASGGPPQTADYTRYQGEMYAIYLLPDYFRQGIGTRLTKAIIDHLRELKKKSFIIWVFKDNPSSRAFYEKLGGKLIGEKRYDIGGQELPAVAYAWDSLDDVVFE